LTSGLRKTQHGRLENDFEALAAQVQAFEGYYVFFLNSFFPLVLLLLLLSSWAIPLSVREEQGGHGQGF
jgi:hypothetical protein